MACPFTPSPHGLCFTPSAVWSYTDSNIQVPTISSLSDFCCWAKVGKAKLIAKPTSASTERIFIFSQRSFGNCTFCIVRSQEENVLDEFLTAHLLTSAILPQLL